MKTVYARNILAILLILGGRVFAQSTASPKSVFDHLCPADGTKITLEADFTTIVANKKTEQYFPGSLTMESGQSFRVDLKPRGKFRRRKAEIPPLKIKFHKKELKAVGLDTFNEVKLVLPITLNEAGEQLLVKEYLAYKMFETLTPVSVRAKLIRIALRDSHVEQAPHSMLAILLEDEEETTARLKGQEIEAYGIPADSLHMNQAALVAVFQYMIGNTDWEIAMIRNVRLIRAPETGKILVVPYDFDFSGLVSAPYASPSSESGLRTVQERFLMANGIKPEALKKATALLKGSKEKLLAICRSKYLNRASIDQMTAYLETYFQQVSEKDEVPQLFKMPPAD